MENPLRSVREAFAEFERAMIRERQREGIAAGVWSAASPGATRSSSTAAQVGVPNR
jgi:DNA invertase Pin-like site-specific DNA recombinase